ncbi:hypothetical protein SAMN04487944_10541 [Gracilibacillus ureilyticus]|uniref:Uncharacterized protein n=1 Tax=Gracilibacillus ureilyticus TaxID=531814 RepID=A0A1H9PK43_9BACI|nr:hypothetical protein [Gracilibacillus ureilyticus]SER48591.1 hypothetical protein SAMN04487944_10541 [Gracilibacillus ureilyticus]
MRRKKILWVIDPYDPVISLQQLYSMCHYHYKEGNSIYIQLLEYHPAVYRRLRLFGKMLPPFSWNNNKVSQNKLNNSYQFVSFSIPKNIRFATYNYPSLVKLYWQHMRKMIHKDERFYDEAVVFSQGLPQFYVKDHIDAKKILTHQHVFQPECEGLFIEKNHLNLTSSSAVLFNFYRNKLPVIFIKSMFAVSNIMATSEMGPNLMNSFPGTKILVPNSWDNSLEIENFVNLCLLMREKKMTDVRLYLLGKSGFSSEIAGLVHKYQLFTVINMVENVNNVYGYIKDTDIYLEWGGHCSFLKEAICFHKPVYSYKFRDHCNTYLDHKIWNKDITRLIELIRNPEMK